MSYPERGGRTAKSKSGKQASANRKMGEMMQHKVAKTTQMLEKSNKKSKKT